MEVQQAQLGQGQEQRPAADGHVQLGQHRGRSRRSSTASACSTRSSGRTARPIRAHGEALADPGREGESTSRAAGGTTKRPEPDHARRTPASRSHVVRDGDSLRLDRVRRTTATRRAGARSPRPTASTTRCALRRGTVALDPEVGLSVTLARRPRCKDRRRETARRARSPTAHLIEVARRGQPAAARRVPRSASPTPGSSTSTRARSRSAPRSRSSSLAATARRADDRSSRARSLTARARVRRRRHRCSPRAATTTRTRSTARSDAETYQNMTAGDIAQKVAQRAGLAGRRDRRRRRAVHDFVQQNNETDWDFLWRLAAAHRLRGRRRRRRSCTSARPAAPAASTVTLRWGEGLTAFRPRVTGVQQVDEVDRARLGPADEAGRSRRRAKDERAARARSASSAPTVRQGARRRHGRSSRPARVHARGGRRAREERARAARQRLPRGRGRASGDPRLRAGSQVKIEGVGERFGGTYALSSTHARLPRRDGLPDALHDLAAARRARLVDLITPAAPRGSGRLASWSAS